MTREQWRSVTDRVVLVVLVLARVASPLWPCPFEASESEQQAQGHADLAQLLFAREKTPVRAVQFAETGTTHLIRLRAAVDAAWAFARRTV